MPEFTSDYAPCRDLLLKRLREPAPGRIQLLTGPRQVGKTTLLLEIAAQFGDAELASLIAPRTLIIEASADAFARSHSCCGARIRPCSIPARVAISRAT